MYPDPAVSAPQVSDVAGAPAGRWRRLRRRTYELLERASAGDRASLYVDIGLIVLITLSVAAVVFESVDSIRTRFEPQFFWFEIFTVAVFSVEYLLRIWSSVEGADATTVKSKPLHARLRFIRSPSAIIDFVAILPFYLVAAGLAGSGDMRFLRAVRLLRVFKLTRYSAAFDTLIKAFSENARSFVAALSILLIVMLLAATGMYYFEHEAQPEAFASIPAAMWWAFATLTTVGFGDVTPITAGGKVFGAMITVVGVGMVALPTGILASAYTEQLRTRADQYREKSKVAWADGVVTATEAAELERLRESLGLHRNTASQILDNARVEAALRGEERHACPHCGRAAD